MSGIVTVDDGRGVSVVCLDELVAGGGAGVCLVVAGVGGGVGGGVDGIGVSGIGVCGMVVHLNPLVVPLQEPVRCWPVGHVMLLHVWHVPGLAPSRYWLVLQPIFGMVVHLNPLLVPLQKPERRWPVGQLMLLHVWHVPGLAPTRYWLVLQPMFGIVVHVNPLVVPLQEPERRWPVGHVMLLHVWHVPGLAPSRYWLVLQPIFGMVVHANPLVVPLQKPERRWPAGHVIRSHALHVPGLAPTRYWLVLQPIFGCGVGTGVGGGGVGGGGVVNGCNAVTPFTQHFVIRWLSLVVLQNVGDVGGNCIPLHENLVVSKHAPPFSVHWSSSRHFPAGGRATFIHPLPPPLLPPPCAPATGNKLARLSKNTAAQVCARSPILHYTPAQERCQLLGRCRLLQAANRTLANTS